MRERSARGPKTAVITGGVHAEVEAAVNRVEARMGSGTIQSCVVFGAEGPTSRFQDRKKCGHTVRYSTDLDLPAYLSCAGTRCVDGGAVTGVENSAVTVGRSAGSGTRNRPGLGCTVR